MRKEGLTWEWRVVYCSQGWLACRLQLHEGIIDKRLPSNPVVSYPCRQSLWLSRPALISHVEPSLPHCEPWYPTSILFPCICARLQWSQVYYLFQNISSLFTCVEPDSNIIDQNSSRLWQPIFAFEFVSINKSRRKRKPHGWFKEMNWTNAYHFQLWDEWSRSRGLWKDLVQIKLAAVMYINSNASVRTRYLQAVRYQKQNMYLALSQLYIWKDIQTVSIPKCNKNITKTSQKHHKNSTRVSQVLNANDAK